MADFTYDENTMNGDTLITLEPSGGVGYTYALETDQVQTSLAIEVDATGAVKVLDATQLPMGEGTSGMMIFTGLIKEDATCYTERVPLEGGFAAAVGFEFGLAATSCASSRGSLFDDDDWTCVVNGLESATFNSMVAIDSNRSRMDHNQVATIRGNIVYAQVPGGMFPVDVEVRVEGFNALADASGFYLLLSNVAPLTGAHVKSWTLLEDLGNSSGVGVPGTFIYTNAQLEAYVDTSIEYYFAIAPAEFYDGTVPTGNMITNSVDFWSIIGS